MSNESNLEDQQEGGRKTEKPKATKITVEKALEIYQKALDDIVNANGLFTIAVFVGLSMAQRGQQSLEDSPKCNAGDNLHLGKQLVVFEVVAFGFYLLSSLVAKALKIHLSVCSEDDFKQTKYKIIRGGLLVLSVWSSILGCIFLTISMVHVIQIRVGKLSCGSLYALRSAWTLISIVALALLIYMPFTMHAIYISMVHLES